MWSRPGLLFIISAPSGAGARRRSPSSWRCRRRGSNCPAHARRDRPDRAEFDGVDYNFVSRDRFEEMVRAGEFLEWADVFGNLYGTRAADTGSAARLRATTSCS